MKENIFVIRNCFDNWSSLLTSHLLSSSLKQMITFSDTGCAVLLCNLSQSRLYLSVCVETKLVDEVVQPVSAKVVLYFAEDCLNWIEHWAVRDVQDRFDV